MINYDSNSFLFGGLGDSHPQFKVIKKHIERSVQDLFLETLRNQSDELVHVFNDNDQIEKFKKRMLTYWETFEEYEICQEVSERMVGFKEKWENRDKTVDPWNLEKIKSLFE
jgi:hypothetical protein